MTAICANINCPNYDAEAERSGQCCSPECVTASLIVIDGGVYVRQTDGTAKLLTGEPRSPRPLTKSERLLGLHGELCNRARQIMVAKNHDYCAGQPDLDPFANFNVTEQVLSIDARLLLLARILDKIQRLRGFLHTGSLAVKDESVDNCIIDMINYSVLFAGMTEECKVQHDQSNPLVVL